MRRKHKYILWGAVIIGVGVALTDILLQWIERKRQGDILNWENFDCIKTLKNASIGAAVGAGLGFGLWWYKRKVELELPFNPDEFLQKVLQEEHLKSNPHAFQEVLRRRNEVKSWLAEEFGTLLVTEPLETGSFPKRTAIASNYDLDIMLVFRKDSYISLKDMYDDVCQKVQIEFGERALVERRTRAVAISFEKGSVSTYFDVVPGREINNFIEDQELNLYVRPDWIWQKGRSFKTNVAVQRKMTVNMPEARATIKLLKIYRDRNNIELPTTVVEQCVVDALSENNFGASRSSAENLLNAMDYIARRLEQKKLTDIANSNNNLLNKMGNIERREVVQLLFEDIRQVEEDPRHLREIFKS